jgi:hypothetical protein
MTVGLRLPSLLLALRLSALLVMTDLIETRGSQAAHKGRGAADRGECR